jgi:hypothetical protein
MVSLDSWSPDPRSTRSSAYRGLPEDLLSSVSSQDVRAYSLATGWKRVDGGPGHLAVFRHPCSNLDQVIVPLDSSAPDYARRIAEAVEALATREDRPPQEVLNDLLQTASDVLRFRVTSLEATRGTLPLEEVVDLLRGAKQALLAAACSVLVPQRHHPRLSRAEAEQLLAACRFGQTERGSFAVAIACPIDAVDTPLPRQNPAPFARETTQLLMRSAERILNSIQRDDEAAALQSNNSDPLISSNFCQALLEMQPPQDQSSLTISCTWAPILALPASAGTVRSVTFRNEHFPAIERIGKRLLPVGEPEHDLFVGYVDALNGFMGDTGEMQGEVTLLLLHESEPIRAKVDLGPRDYRTAAEAHMSGSAVSVRGSLHLGRRIHRLRDIGGFSRVAPSTER